ncbi:purple acid phosphatase family protein [Vulgatibacter incomptus]|nr:metallophosphoesterase family protein [Vulgatibacter incomptus]
MAVLLAIALLGCSSDPPGARLPYVQQTSSSGTVIAWRTLDAGASEVAFGTDPAHMNRTASDPAEVRHHRVRIANLTPSTRYYYKVTSSDDRVATQHWFRTAPPPGAREPFRIWVLGDSGNGKAPQRSVRDAMLTVAAGRRPDLVVHVGDLAYPAGTEAELDRGVFDPYESVLSTTPFWPTLGNHEAQSVSGTSGPYFDAFAVPTNGEAGGEPSGTPSWYSFDWGNAHFAVLDSSNSSRRPGSPMLTWLERDLSASTADWKLAVFHHPPYSSTNDAGADPENQFEMRRYVVPILEAAGVDIVLNGHSHLYERTYLVNGATSADADPARFRMAVEDPVTHEIWKESGPNKGTLYLVAGHGGADLDWVAPGYPMIAFAEAAHGSCLVDVDGLSITVRNVRIDGVVSDTFTLKKPPPP